MHLARIVLGDENLIIIMLNNLFATKHFAAGIVAVARFAGMGFLAQFGVATEGSSRQTAFAKNTWQQTDYKRKAR